MAVMAQTRGLVGSTLYSAGRHSADSRLAGVHGLIALPHMRGHVTPEL